jgi:hypothetical protein
MMTWNVRGYRHAPLIVVATAFLLAGCAELTVTKVTDSNNATVAGVRYYLPKPYLQVTPQADGTISVDVIYLPDKTHAYAIDTSSKLSSYTLQVSRDEKGLLTAIEYKASTTAVGQQLAASAGAAAVQAYNIRAAQQAAVQTQVNTAAAAVDTANANLQAANAALASDKALGASETALLSDNNAVAQAAAKLQAAQQALQRVQITAQAVNTSVASGPAGSTTAPQMGTIFGQPTWSTATVANLPSKFGPLLFAINDTVKNTPSGKVESVELKAVTSDIPGSISANDNELEDKVKSGAQRAFETVATALGPPTLAPLSQTVLQANKQASVSFSRAICEPSTKECKALSSKEVFTDPGHTDTNTAGTLGNDYRTVSIDITKLIPGDYEIDLTFTYPVAPQQVMGPVTLKAKFTVAK